MLARIDKCECCIFASGNSTFFGPSRRNAVLVKEQTPNVAWTRSIANSALFALYNWQRDRGMSHVAMFISISEEKSLLGIPLLPGIRGVAYRG